MSLPFCWSAYVEKTMIGKSIFNANKKLSEYRNTPLFCGQEPALADTIYKKYPELWKLYKEMKSLDWDENEFDYTRCFVEFKTTPSYISDKMIKTIGWQWEADSVAGRSFLMILAPFISSTELWTGLLRISDNENVHSASYSEIIKLSFDNPDEVIQGILDFKATQNRLRVLTETLENALYLSRQYAAGLIPLTDDLYRDVVLKTIICMLFLERIQFMASFGITFTICSTGLFQPIGKAVQKICQDELEVHAEFDKAVLKYELDTERGRRCFEQLEGWIENLAVEFFQSEFSFIDEIHSDGMNLIGSTPDLFKQWVLFNGKDPLRFLKVDLDRVLDRLGTTLTYPKKNPMPLLESWININLTQAAPQEQDLAAYKVGVVVDDSEDLIFDF